MLQGCCTALITPFKKNGSIDCSLYKKQILRQINAGVSGILSCGTTGEAPALSEDELGKNIKTAVNAARGKVYVVAGTGTNNTINTIRRTKYAESVGADYALIITPYYNKPNQTGLYKHFKQVASNTKMDIIIYNVPSRTSVSISPDTVAALSRIKNIVAIKEASGSINQATEILIKAKKGFTIMSGDDVLTLPLMSIGASGVISTTSNLAPSYMQSLFELYFANSIPEAKKMHKFLYPIIKAMFIETNPIPLKFAMKEMKLDTGTLRMPLSELSKENKKKIIEILKLLKK